MEIDAGPQPNIKRNLDNHAEKGEKGLKKPGVSRTPGENLKKQLTLAQRGSQVTEQITRKPTLHCPRHSAHTLWYITLSSCMNPNSGNRGFF